MNKIARIVLRVGDMSLAFAVKDSTVEQQLVYEPYVVRSGISMAANLREAFNKSNLLSQDYTRAQVVVDSPVLIIPEKEFVEDDVDTLYHHAVSGLENHAVLTHALPELDAVALFSINKDLRLVITDHYNDVIFTPLMSSVWQHFYRNKFDGNKGQLFVHQHGSYIDVFGFSMDRFRFVNSFKTKVPADMAYFVLAVFSQLGMKAEQSEIFLNRRIPKNT